MTFQFLLSKPGFSIVVLNFLNVSLNCYEFLCTSVFWINWFKSGVKVVKIKQIKKQQQQFQL